MAASLYPATFLTQCLCLDEIRTFHVTKYETISYCFDSNLLYSIVYFLFPELAHFKVHRFQDAADIPRTVFFFCPVFYLASDEPSLFLLYAKEFRSLRLITWIFNYSFISSKSCGII